MIARRCGAVLSGLRLLWMPVTGRNPRRIAALMHPGLLNHTYVWLVEQRGERLLIYVHGSSYEVVWRRRQRYDPLSGLSLRLMEAEGRVDGRVVWRMRWMGGRYEASLSRDLSFINIDTCVSERGVRISDAQDFCRLILPRDL